AVVVIRVARDGSIPDVPLKPSSGNRLMDQSVLAAVHKARMLEPPPDALLKGAAAEIVVDFHLEG
ncbi:MAG: TonB C-terminal domain-containing protein, partial [Verrucomicrobiae bacterium]|nr:TonB C-terminal domain-containing protein [Verrucomicrobiae bacterium]